ncbi:MAG TPA: aminotransferase class V-fold PLP-dependent enzyme, partial [Fimbriimonadaceae bacterium]|nr:aminotransferase class V-fold PLP-dependent enzyme [Fimbriimonadaceae bacterium]
KLGADRLQPGDEVLTTDQDYPRMINGFKQRVRREGIKMVQVSFPNVPNSKQELVDAIEGGITDKTKVILICHVINLTGQIWPVRDVVELGRKRGIPVIVDGAHAFAQFPFDRDGLDCDYYGTSLHKWLMAPIGTGFLYVRKKNIEPLWPLMADNDGQHDNIRKFEEIGTHPAANHNAIAEALTFHEMIGVARKAERLRYLRSVWVDKIRGEKNVRFNTNLLPEHSCGLTNVEIVGIEPGKLAGWLLNEYGILVTTIGHKQFQGIRVTPNVYSTLSEVRLFGDAMLRACREGIA